MKSLFGGRGTNDFVWSDNRSRARREGRTESRGAAPLGVTTKSALFLHSALNVGHIVRDFVDRFLDRLDVGMDFSENRVLLFRNLFDSFGLSFQLIEHGILSAGNSVHPPEAYTPAGNIRDSQKVVIETWHIFH